MPELRCLSVSEFTKTHVVLLMDLELTGWYCRMLSTVQ